MGDAVLDQLVSVPWAADLINDPKWTRTRTASRLPKASGEDSFFAETLSTDRTIKAFLTLKPTEEVNDDFAYHEIVTIVQVGDGLNGYPQILHGGFVATLLDEVCGILIVVNLERSIERVKESGGTSTPSMNYMTAYLNTIYKNPVPAPGTIKCTAKLERRDGRKLYVRSTIENGATGVVCTIGEAMFVEVKPRL
ncbi:HotDog domain-containing protein [Paraphoma chrysanthemicola]|uniref:HotDog domain-containing protein n=1 Tax=Paraphoma chrysanthemicola TaxID=798071 RepID=A0A8K0R5R7_9PLEO|nr:HotDog domain-containing protein [Paraphoma chrysanthemicola]